MEGIKIGNSEELITVTRERWDALKFEKDDLELKIRSLTAGGSILILKDRWTEDFEILSCDDSVRKLSKLLKESRKKEHEANSLREDTVRYIKRMRHDMVERLKNLYWFNKRKTRRELIEMFNKKIDKL